MKKNQEQEVDFYKLFLTLQRRKKLVFIITLLGFMYGIFKSYTTQPVWQGEFQIVIGDSGKNKTQDLQAFNLLSQLNSGNSATALKTQVKILESPSVLMPIFQFVRNYKSDSQSPRNMRYEDWADNNLNISLEAGTSVLTIAYKDTNKKVINPVLNKISSAYQEYSGRQKNKSVKNTINFLEGQIKLFKKKSSSSMREFQKFSSENGLGSEDGIIQNTSQVLNNLNLSNNLAANNIYDENTKNRYQNHFLKLSQLEAQLVEKEALLTPNSSVITDLKTRIGALKKSLDKPNEVLNKYRELKLLAIREEITLIKLQDQLNILNLELSQQDVPWQLISTPTLLDKPVAPQKKKLTLTYTFLAFFMASILSIILDKKSKVIFSFYELQDIVPYPLLKVFQSEEVDQINDGVNFLFNKYINKENNKNDQKIAILSMNEIDNFIKDKLINAFKVNFPNKEIFITENLNEIIGYEIKFLMANSQNVKLDRLNTLIRDLQNNSNEVKGWIYFEK